MVKFGAQGYYSWVVLNKKNEVVRYSPTREKNLILDQGLDGIAVRSWADSFVACAVGTGTSSPSASQTALDAESKRTNVYLDLTAANNSEYADGEFVLKRTFVFTPESSTTTYTEAGFSWTVTGPGALFSRVRFAGVEVSSGERLIIQYELHVLMTPVEPTVIVDSILNLVPSGLFQYQFIGLKGVNSLGQSYDFDAGLGCNEPSIAAKAFLSNSDDALAVIGSSADRSGTVLERDATLSTYVPGSFSRVKTLSFGPKEAKTFWRSFGIGASIGNSYINSGLVCVADESFYKGPGTLNINFTYTWNRFTRQNYSALFYWQDEEALFLRRQNPLLSYFNLSNE